MDQAYSTNAALLVGALVSAVLLVTFAVLLRSLISARRGEPVAAPALDQARPDRYRPMLRLLSTQDLEFLKTQVGYRPALGRRLMAERRRVMRAYLRRLHADFDAIHRAATQLVMMAPNDQPELARELIRQRIIFSRNIAIAHLNLCLSPFGLGEVKVAQLVEALTSVEQKFNYLAGAMLERSEGFQTENLSPG